MRTIILAAGIIVLATMTGHGAYAESDSEHVRQANLILKIVGCPPVNIDTIAAENARLNKVGISRELANKQRLEIFRSSSCPK